MSLQFEEERALMLINFRFTSNSSMTFRDSSLLYRNVVWRRDGRRRFASIVSHDVKILFLASLGTFCRRRNERRRDARRRPASVMFCSILRLIFGAFAIIRHRDARRRSHNFRTLVLPFSEICVCVGTKGIATLGVRLSASCRTASWGLSLVYSESCVGVLTIGVVEKHRLPFCKVPAQNTVYWCMCPLPPVIHFI
jgi:hypothetical protein